MPPQRTSSRCYSIALKPGAMDDFIAVVTLLDQVAEAGDEALLDEPPQTMRVICPDGVSPGDALFVQTPDGQEITTQVPEVIDAGMEFEVDLSGLLDPAAEEAVGM